MRLASNGVDALENGIKIYEISHILGTVITHHVGSLWARIHRPAFRRLFFRDIMGCLAVTGVQMNHKVVHVAHKGVSFYVVLSDNMTVFPTPVML